MKSTGTPKSTYLTWRETYVEHNAVYFVASFSKGLTHVGDSLCIFGPFQLLRPARPVVTLSPPPRFRVYKVLVASNFKLLPGTVGGLGTWAGVWHRIHISTHFYKCVCVCLQTPLSFSVRQITPHTVDALLCFTILLN